MAKGGKKRSRLETGNSWSAADHAERSHSKRRNSTQKQADRTALLTHDTREKRNGIKLQLHVRQTQRHVEALRNRLRNWDPVEEAAQVKKREEEEEEAQRRQQQLQEEPTTKKKRGRKGPETWKLRGAARPAHEVYDFDTRYVDPHLAAHKQAREKAQRRQNLLHPRLFDPHTIPACREYLGLLMQLGHICAEARQYKSAREAWLECLELDNNNDNDSKTDHPNAPLTSARDALMRLYLQLHRYEAAHQLGQRFAQDDSVWMRYHAALAASHLVEHRQKKKVDDDEQQVDKDESLQLTTIVAQAVQSNIFCAYYLAHYDTFANVMECTEDLEDADHEPQTSLEEAIEYCNDNDSSAALLWRQNPRALATLRSVLHHGGGCDGSPPLLSTTDLDWDARLTKIEDEFHQRQRQQSSEEDESADGGGCGASLLVDLGMYARQFRTAMEMIGDAGDLSAAAAASAQR